jgi:hypothetical protein
MHPREATPIPATTTDLFINVFIFLAPSKNFHAILFYAVPAKTEQRPAVVVWTTSSCNNFPMAQDSLWIGRLQEKCQHDKNEYKNPNILFLKRKIYTVPIRKSSTSEKI